MAVERIYRDSMRTPEDKTRLQAVRERFETERPNLQQLVAEDGYNEPVPHGAYLGLQLAMRDLKQAREAAGLTLAQVAEKSGIDKAALSKLETGRQINPTVATLARYAMAIGKQFRWMVIDADNPAPGSIAVSNPGNAATPTLILEATASSEASKESSKKPKKPSPEIEIITNAYVAVSTCGSEVHSSDRVIADPALDAQFLEQCRKLGAVGSDFDLNWRLFNARKASQLADTAKADRFSIPRAELDQFLFASEIGLRIVLDEWKEKGKECSLDRIICDPELARYFDTVAGRLAPGFSSLYYRWGAIGLRKAAGRLRVAAENTNCPKFDSVIRLRDVNPSKLPAAQGLYLIGVNEQHLFVGDTLNIRGRIERHMQVSGGEVLPDWVLGNYNSKDLTLGVLPIPGSRNIIDVCELKAKTVLKPALNFIL